MPIGTTTMWPARRSPGLTKWPTLGACSATVRSASTAGPAISPVEASTPEAMSSATTAAAEAFISAIASAATPSATPAETGAEDGVERDVGVADRLDAVDDLDAEPFGDLEVEAGVALVDVAAGDREHGHLDAGVEQLAGDDEAVAAVVALAGIDHDALGRRRRSMSSRATAAPARSMRWPPGMPSPSIAAASVARIFSAVKQTDRQRLEHRHPPCPPAGLDRSSRRRPSPAGSRTATAMA